MATENTGYKGYSTLLKVANDGNNSPLDINNNLCSESGLPQATKSNTIGDPDYIAPVYDIVTCPLPYFAYNFSTLTNNNTVTACGYAFGLTLYSADNLLDVGSILYTDTELTSVFVGDNLYHSLQTAGTNKYVRINTVGVVIIIGDC